MDWILYTMYHMFSGLQVVSLQSLIFRPQIEGWGIFQNVHLHLLRHV